MTPVLEVCCGDLQSAWAAAQGGAQRIELCAALPLDGLTPSAGMIAAARQIPGLRLHVLIRPREGDFVYSPEEFCIMEHDIHVARQLGADGVVIGALTPEGDIDVSQCRQLMQAAEGMDVTFHRAFDRCRDPHAALEAIIRLGCSRLLTSGQQSTALQGLPLLQSLVRQAQGRIIIMPGAGVGLDNASTILREASTTEIHGSFRTQMADGLHTDAALVRRVMESLPHD